MTKVLVYCASVLIKQLWNWISSCTIIFSCIHCFPHYFGDRIAILYCIQYYYVDECCRHLLVISKTTVLVLAFGFHPAESDLELFRTLATQVLELR